MLPVPCFSFAAFEGYGCKIGSGWDIDSLHSLVGSSKVEELLSFLATRRDGKDILVWTDSLDGSFLTKRM